MRIAICGDSLGTVACGCRAVGTLHKGEDLTRSTGWLPESCGFFYERLRPGTRIAQVPEQLLCPPELDSSYELSM
jgi:hypothetical protein